MKLISITLLLVILLGSICFSSCRLLNKDDQQSGSSNTQQQSSNTSAAALKTKVWIEGDTNVAENAYINVKYSVSKKATLTLTVRTPDGKSSDRFSNTVNDAGTYSVKINAGSVQGNGTITLSAATPTGEGDISSASYAVVKPNNNVLWGDYQYVNPNK
jgi:hypothetical protein